MPQIIVSFFHYDFDLYAWQLNIGWGENKQLQNSCNALFSSKYYVHTCVFEDAVG